MNLQSPTPPLKNQHAPKERRATLLSARRYLIGGGALILVLGGYWYYNQRGNGDVRNVARFSVVPVRVAKVEIQDMPIVERTIGTVVANVTVQVTPQVQGVLAAAYFKEGQIVKKGDPLFQIDPRPFQAALNQAKGQLTKDQATLDGARRDLKRYQVLMAVNAESQQIVDDEEATVATDEGLVQSDNANVETAQINLGYTRIVSPIDGKTGPILIQPGNFISATGVSSNTTSTGATSSTTPLVTINQISPIKISFFLPQSDLPSIQARQKTGGLVAIIDSRDVGGENLTAPINFIGNAVNNLTGTIELRATYDNSDAALVPGQLVNVVVELNDIPHATVIPHEALNLGPDTQYVYVVSGGKAEKRNVKVLFDNIENIAVQGYLKPGDQVVVDGQLQIVPGGAVEIVKGERATGGKRNAVQGRRG